MRTIIRFDGIQSNDAFRFFSRDHHPCFMNMGRQTWRDVRIA